MIRFEHEEVVGYLRGLVGHYVGVTPWPKLHAASPVPVNVRGVVRQVREHEWYVACVLGTDERTSSRFLVPHATFAGAWLTLHTRDDGVEGDAQVHLRIDLGAMGVLDVHDLRLDYEQTSLPT